MDLETTEFLMDHIDDFGHLMAVHQELTPVAFGDGGELVAHPYLRHHPRLSRADDLPGRWAASGGPGSAVQSCSLGPGCLVGARGLEPPTLSRVNPFGGNSGTWHNS